MQSTCELDLLILHEIVSFSLTEDEDEFFREVFEKATRVLNIKQMALFIKENSHLKCQILFGFRSDKDARKMLENPDKRFIYNLDDLGYLILIPAYPLSHGVERIYTIFAKRIGDYLRYKKLEEEKKILEKKSILFNSIPDAVIVIRNNIIVDANDTWRCMMGPDTLGKPLHKIRSFDRESRKKLKELVDKWQSGKKIIVKAKIGNSQRYFAINSASLGRDCVILVFRDITGLKIAEKKIRKMNFYLKLLNKILRHDIKNHLAIMRNFLEICRENPDSRFFDIIDERIDICSEIISKAKEIENALTSEETKSVYLSEILLREIEKIKHFENVHVEYDIPDGIYVEADDMLSSVFENILLNAIYHNDKDVKKIAVSVNVLDSWVAVKIADNGPGIPDDMKEKVFEEGVKGQTGRGGLGLFIVKILVEKYGGMVWVEDNKPEGSIFTVMLKRSEVSEQSLAKH